MHDVIRFVSALIWGRGTIAAILACGIIFTLRLGFPQIRSFGKMIKLPFSHRGKTDGISPFAAMATALAGTMGVGNIIGVGAAISIGGAGAVFWMWISAFFGMATKYAEINLAVKYRIADSSGQPLGGPMAYIEHGLKMPVLAKIFCVITVTASFCVGNAVQVCAITESVNNFSSMPRYFIAAIVAIISAAVIFGGAKRISKVAAAVTPVLSLAYIAGCILIISRGNSGVSVALREIFYSAFSPMAAVGGIAGGGIMLSMRTGIAHGVFSNEAGMGSSSIAHASGNCESAHIQGLWGMFEVFFDTIVTCTLTALAIIVSGDFSSLPGADVTSAAFSSVFGAAGGIFIAVSVSLFAVGTLLSWSFYGEKCITYLGAENHLWLYRTAYVLVAGLSCFSAFGIVLDMCDILNGLMVIPNIFALFLLRRQVSGVDKKAENDYNNSIKSNRFSEASHDIRSICQRIWKNRTE